MRHGAQVQNGAASQSDNLFTESEWDTLATTLGLSKRELQILQGVCADRKDAAIASELGISTHTVRTHFERLYRKLGVFSRSGLVVAVFSAYLRRDGSATVGGTRATGKLIRHPRDRAVSARTDGSNTDGLHHR